MTTYEFFLIALMLLACSGYHFSDLNLQTTKARKIIHAIGSFSIFIFSVRMFVFALDQ